MRALVVRTPGPDAEAELVEVPTPEPGAGAVRIEVRAATVNPVDLMVRAGIGGTPFAAPRDQWGLGWDVAGVVDAVGEGVTDLVVGQRVIGLSDRLDVSLAAQADYVVLDRDQVTPIPDALDDIAAATIPLNGLTATQALNALDLRPGETLLVTGAAGAVGGYAVELASAAGIHVVALADAADEPLLRTLGAAETLPRTTDLAATVRARHPGGVDAALDAAALGPATLGAVRTLGRFASVTAHTTPIPLRGITVTTVFAHADRAQLESLTTRATAGALTLRIAETLPLASYSTAHQRLTKGGLRGRIVLVP